MIKLIDEAKQIQEEIVNVNFLKFSYSNNKFFMILHERWLFSYLFDSFKKLKTSS
jgi:uncharacterized phage-associated protein